MDTEIKEIVINAFERIDDRIKQLVPKMIDDHVTELHRPQAIAAGAIDAIDSRIEQLVPKMIDMAVSNSMHAHKALGHTDDLSDPNEQPDLPWPAQRIRDLVSVEESPIAAAAGLVAVQLVLAMRACDSDILLTRVAPHPDPETRAAIPWAEWEDTVLAGEDDMLVAEYLRILSESWIEIDREELGLDLCYGEPAAGITWTPHDPPRCRHRGPSTRLVLDQLARVLGWLAIMAGA